MPTVHVHEAAQRAGLVEDAPLDAGVVGVEVVEDRGQGVALGAHLGLTPGVGGRWWGSGRRQACGWLASDDAGCDEGVVAGRDGGERGDPVGDRVEG